jgi:hypothetical protein
MIVLSAMSASSALEMKHMQEKLRKIHPVPLFGYGGRAFDLDPKLAGQVPGQYLGSTLEKAFLSIKELLTRHEKKPA